MKHPKQKTDYGIQMTEKQKARFTYGVGERQFARYVEESMSKKGVKPADELYSTLESRLDNVVYRSGYATTRAFARQMVNHGHITVNGKKLNIPSAQLRIGDKVAIRLGSQKKPLFANFEERLKTHTTPSWIKFNFEKKEAEIQGEPKAIPTALLFNLGMILEFYSR